MLENEGSLLLRWPNFLMDKENDLYFHINDGASATAGQGMKSQVITG